MCIRDSSKAGSISAALAGGRLDAGNGTISASAGTMNFQDAFTVGETMGILANCSGTITGNVTVDGGRLYYTSMDNVGSVLQNVTLTSGLDVYKRQALLPRVSVAWAPSM